MTKSQQYFQDMIENHKDLFDAFKVVNDNYAEEPKKYQQQLNELGEDVLNVIRKYENMLCSEAEGGKYGKFSNKTAEKFWEFVRGYIPKVDFVGLK